MLAPAACLTILGVLALIGKRTLAARAEPLGASV
jgi:hypothetical protein